MSNLTKMGLSEFISATRAVKQKDGTWEVFEGIKAPIRYCQGENEFEAKEDAWRWLKDVTNFN